jgi:hypothetical protein
MYAYMQRARRQRRAVTALVLLLAFCRCASASDPSLDVSQYAHTAWTQTHYPAKQNAQLGYHPGAFVTANVNTLIDGCSDAAREFTTQPILNDSLVASCNAIRPMMRVLLLKLSASPGWSSLSDHHSGQS